MEINKHRSSSTAVASSSSTSSSSSGSDSESTDRRGSRRHKSDSRKHRSRKERDRDEKSSKRGWKSSRKNKEEERKKKRRRRRERKHKRRRSRRDEASSSEYSGSDEEDEDIKEKSEVVVRGILEKFPDVADDLKQLLQLVDSGQAVDVSGIPNRELVKLLMELFHLLKLKEADGLFLLPPKRPPTLATVGSFLNKQAKPSNAPISVAPENLQSSTLDQEHTEETEPQGRSDTSAPQRRRLIGPEMPSSELLAAAAMLTEAEAAVRDGVLEGDDDLFIGPPPPAVAAEAESTNEAERFEEVGRIIGADIDKPYDVLSVNHRMSLENMKKRYWKLSLMVHPDKCSHPQAHQAFVMLNQAFKELQDPEKRKAIDEKIKIKEEEEAFKAELKSLREAAQWRRLQGISMEGDDVLLAEPEKPQVRDEWMTNLPPERKPGVSMQSKTSFCRAGKEGRGDTSLWTDNPLDRSAKAKQNYLEAYNKATALAAADDDRKRTDSVGDFVDKYNLSKRSKSLVEKHREESSQRRKKEKQKPKEKEDWIGQHPWKPWDREKDLTAGRQKVNLDSDGMAKGLASRFSSGSVQRNFL